MQKRFLVRLFANRVHHQQHQVTRHERFVDFTHHAAVELRRSYVNAGRIHKYDLRRRMFAFALGDLDHSVDTGARGLRFGRDDCDLLADERIQQCGLAGVGPADDGDEA